MTSGGAIRRVEDVRRFASCTGCGVCAGCCPVQALSMVVDAIEQVYYPAVDRVRCTECGLCLRVCPEIREAEEGENGWYVPIPEFPELLQENHLQGDAILGKIESCYLGHAQDETLRFRAASGGICSTILTDALEAGLIDGAVVVRMDPEHPLRPEPFIATTVEEIESAARSKYCPVPLGVVLKEVMAFEGRLAVVGLPCHIRAFRKAARAVPQVRDHITLWIGLFCLQSVSFMGTFAVLRRLGVNVNEVARLHYRGYGWPGGIWVCTHAGEEYRMRHDVAWGALFTPFFSPISCTVCYEAAAELSDVSLMDAWSSDIVKPTGKGKETDNPGESFVVARTERGQSLIRQLALRQRIQVQEVDRNTVLRSQQYPCIVKKQAQARSSILHWFGRLLNVRAPERASVTMLRPNLFAYVSALLTYLNICLLRSPWVTRLWERLPIRLLRIYGHFYWLPGAVSAGLYLRRLVGQ